MRLPPVKSLDLYRSLTSHLLACTYDNHGFQGKDASRGPLTQPACSLRGTHTTFLLQVGPKYNRDQLYSETQLPQRLRVRWDCLNMISQTCSPQLCSALSRYGVRRSNETLVQLLKGMTYDIVAYWALIIVLALKNACDRTLSTVPTVPHPLTVSWTQVSNSVSQRSPQWTTYKEAQYSLVCLSLLGGRDLCLRFSRPGHSSIIRAVRPQFLVSCSSARSRRGMELDTLRVC